ncbi:MAG: hypothetical protein M1814_005513 [Vezdaea aestivalis]|nr:MAG: hypothetical protein M1814_005513 [Vezdaea aestivalis]
MKAFMTSRKRRRESPVALPEKTSAEVDGDEDETTEVKLAVLASLHPDIDSAVLLDFLLAAEGSVERALAAFSELPRDVTVKLPKVVNKSSTYQSSLSAFALAQASGTPNKKAKVLTKKGQTLHVYSPEDVAANTPCSIIHSFLDPPKANSLLTELLAEAKTFERSSFKLFDNVVQSPHTASFFVDNLEEVNEQKTEYLYNGYFLSDVRQITPQMRLVSTKVKEAVNTEIARRIQTHYPEGKKLRFQSPKEWCPNAAFVNCYAGGTESVGYHSDQLTYLGPRAVIGSLSLGVAREFRVRRIVPRDEPVDPNSKDDSTRADAEGQIAIHLPHNSLLVMHAEMQEEWKHSIAPAQSIDPHPVAGNRRINVTYRNYRPSFHPRLTPRCKCGVAAVLRAVQKKKENWGKYFWMCHAGAVPDKDKEGCSYFTWAEFDDDGEPLKLAKDA